VVECASLEDSPVGITLLIRLSVLRKWLYGVKMISQSKLTFELFHLQFQCKVEDGCKWMLDFSSWK